MSVTPMATCETALIGIALFPCPWPRAPTQAATPIGRASTAGRAAEQPDANRAREIDGVDRLAPLRIHPGDQRAERAPLLLGGALQRLPEDRLEPERCGMA